MTYLLDTCVVSELVARSPNQGVVDWVDTTDDRQLFLSVITIGEIARGVERLPESQRKQVLYEWLDTELTERFAGRILALDYDVMRRWGRLVAELERAGQSQSVMDSLIAATALHSGMTLVTRNLHDFHATGVALLNPWR